MVIRHKLVEVESRDGLYWCETCVMSFRAHAKPKKGHAWNFGIRNLAEVRNRPGNRKLFPRPRLRSDRAT